MSGSRHLGGKSSRTFFRLILTFPLPHLRLLSVQGHLLAHHPLTLSAPRPVLLLALAVLSPPAPPHPAPSHPASPPPRRFYEERLTLTTDRRGRRRRWWWWAVVVAVAATVTGEGSSVGGRHSQAPYHAPSLSRPLKPLDHARPPDTETESHTSPKEVTPFHLLPRTWKYLIDSSFWKNLKGRLGVPLEDTYLNPGPIGDLLEHFKTEDTVRKEKRKRKEDEESLEHAGTQDTIRERKEKEEKGHSLEHTQTTHDKDSSPLLHSAIDHPLRKDAQGKVVSRRARAINARVASFTNLPAEHRGSLLDLPAEHKDSPPLIPFIPPNPHQPPQPPAPAPAPYQYHHHDHKTGVYVFGYGDGQQWRHEERGPKGQVRGGYGWRDERGKNHVTHFVADTSGYRVVPRNKQVWIFGPPTQPTAPSSPSATTTTTISDIADTTIATITLTSPSAASAQGEEEQDDSLNTVEPQSPSSVPTGRPAIAYPLPPRPTSWLKPSNTTKKPNRVITRPFRPVNPSPTRYRPPRPLRPLLDLLGLPRLRPRPRPKPYPGYTIRVNGPSSAENSIPTPIRGPHSTPTGTRRAGSHSRPNATPPSPTPGLAGPWRAGRPLPQTFSGEASVPQRPPFGQYPTDYTLLEDLDDYEYALLGHEPHGGSSNTLEGGDNMNIPEGSGDMDTLDGSGDSYDSEVSGETDMLPISPENETALATTLGVRGNQQESHTTWSSSPAEENDSTTLSPSRILHPHPLGNANPK
ncbi:hypothetical protein O3P69_015084 [Scylla paramamosain]|uniref:Uncharacterized protein n=1 Tax=Scylla paramamosain TaxID=85552 RepID=A0AAW0T5Z0_SCYPA